MSVERGNPNYIPELKVILEKVAILRPRLTNKEHPEYNQQEVDNLYTIMKQQKQNIVNRLKYVTNLSEKYELQTVLKELSDSIAIFEGNVSNELLRGGKIRRRRHKRTNKRRTKRVRTRRVRTRHRRK